MRIIAKLDIKGPNLVKGIHMEGLRVLGNPEYFAEYYYQEGIDELVYIDVVASLYNRNSLTDLIKRTASNIFVPLTVGGGIRSLDDIKNVLDSGADKVYLNTSAINDPTFITAASRKYGSSTIVIGMEILKQPNGQYFCYTNNGREETGREAISWAQEVQKLGAGEIFITFIDTEGLAVGLDLFFIRELLDTVNIPVVVTGGIGKASQIVELSNINSLSGIAIASLLHYNAIKQTKVTNFTSEEGNKTFLSTDNEIENYMNMDKLSIRQIKGLIIKSEE
jgi:imidazole glycerol-phosphate synthase subunit HisF